MLSEAKHLYARKSGPFAPLRACPARASAAARPAVACRANDRAGTGERSEGVTSQRTMNEYHVYIMTNHSRTLYTGVTNDLKRRVYQHKHKLIPGFTSKYNITQLVYFETTTDVKAAVAREKQIKGWLKETKIALIDSINPQWQDLSVELFDESGKPK